MTVVDLHNLNDRAKRFVVGVILRKAFEDKERRARPGRCSSSCSTSSTSTRRARARARSRRSCSTWPSGVARSASSSSAPSRRRARSSGASSPTRRSAWSAASTRPRPGRGEYGFLPAVQRQRATIAQAGHDDRVAARAAGAARRRVPVPGVGDARRRGRPAPTRPRPTADAPSTIRSTGCPMKILHTADWHVGRLLRGRSRADEHEAVLAEIAAIAPANEASTLVLVVGDLFDSAAPVAEAERIVYRALLDLAATGATVLSCSPATTTATAGCRRWRRCSELGRVVTRAELRPARRGRRGRGAQPRRPARRRWWPPCRSCRSAASCGPTDLMEAEAADARRAPTPTACGRLIAALTAPVPGRHRQRRRRPLHGRRGRRSAAASGSAHTIFEYSVPRRRVPGRGPLRRPRAPAPPADDPGRRAPSATRARRCSSTSARRRGRSRRVVLVDAEPGPAGRGHRRVPLTGGPPAADRAGHAGRAARRRRRPRSGPTTTCGCVVARAGRVGLADEVRDLFPECGRRGRRTARRPSDGRRRRAGAGRTPQRAVRASTWPSRGSTTGAWSPCSTSCSSRPAHDAMRPVRLELEGFAAFREPTVVDFDGADLFALIGPTGCREVDHRRRHRLRPVRVGAPLRRPAAGRARRSRRAAAEARVRLDFTVGDRTYTAVRVVRRTKDGRVDQGGPARDGRRRGRGRQREGAGRGGRAAARPRASTTSAGASCCPRASSPDSCTTSPRPARSCWSSCSTSASTGDGAAGPAAGDRCRRPGGRPRRPARVAGLGHP